MAADLAAPAPAGSRFALSVLVVLVIVSPWPFGSVHFRATQAIALVSLVAAMSAFLWDGGHRQLLLPPRALLWPLLGLWLLAVVQLVPLPQALHRAIAPASAAVWHPDVPAAAAVLGPGPHPISLYPGATRRWLAFATGLVALAIAAAPALRERRLLLRACACVVGGAVLVALYGFVARVAFGSKLFGVWSVPTVAPFGPFVSKNHFAGYVELAALLAAGLGIGLASEARHGPGWLTWVESKRAKWVVLAFGAAFVLVLAVPVSLSRGGVVSLCAGLLVFGGLRLWTHGPARVPAGVVAVAITVVLMATIAIAVALPAEARSRVLTLGGITSDQSGSYRIGLWRDTLRLVAASPLAGSGFGAYADALPRFKTGAGELGIEHAENDHLELLAEGGAAAVLFGGSAAVVLGLLSLRALAGERRRMTRGVLTASLAGLAALVVHSAFDFNLRVPSNALLAAFLAALPVACTIRAGKGGTTAGRDAASWTICLALAGALVCATLTSWSQKRSHSTAFMRVTAPSPRDLRRASVRAELLSLLRHRPGLASAWVQLGWVLLPEDPDQARAVARWGVALDPQHEALGRISRALR